jgi:methylmalonyl-CoA mutase C-terminal domain/subunit
VTARVLIAKPGLDGHDRGALMVARALRDAGFEVVYSGLRQTPAGIARSAIAEDVAVVGLSVLAGGHVGLATRVVEALRADGAGDIAVVVGGVIPDEDVPVLEAAGVAKVFPSGTPLHEVVEQMRDLVAGDGGGASIAASPPGRARSAARPESTIDTAGREA